VISPLRFPEIGRRKKMQIETTENHVEKTAPRKMNAEKMQQNLAYRFSEKTSRGAS
jgi:hypothetical protein